MGILDEYSSIHQKTEEIQNSLFSFLQHFPLKLIPNPAHSLLLIITKHAFSRDTC